MPALQMVDRFRNFITHHKVLFITWCLIFICNVSFSQNSFVYDFKKTANLKINYTNNLVKQVWYVFSYNMFPEQKNSISDTIPAGDGTRNYEFLTSWPQKITLTTSGNELTFLLTPGSKLVCTINFADLTKIYFEAADSLDAINEYLFKKDFSGKVPFRVRRTIVAQQAATLVEFATKMDDIYHDELQFFNENKSKLPTWYQKYEYWENRYSDSGARMNIIPVREYAKKAKEVVPATYYSFLDSIQANDQSAKNFPSYYFFLYELYNKRMKDEALLSGKKPSFLEYHIKQANNQLSGDALDLFKAYIIQLTYNHYKKDVAKDYIKHNDSIFSKSIWLDQLSAYFTAKDDFIGKGKTPPNFVLVDLKDSLTSLRSLKGNVIVLSFWFAGCKGCIEEFPAENALTEKFKNKPVKIVSVCVNTSETQWKQWSKRFDLKTINLWANAQWEKTIIEKYDLNVFPKYVLIDQSHKIIDDNPERPSQGLERQINALLEK